MTQDKETLREAVARAICKACWPSFPDNHIDEMFDAYIPEADAAIATMFERLQNVSQGMLDAAFDNKDEHMEDIWQAMLDKFQQENSDGR